MPSLRPLTERQIVVSKPGRYHFGQNLILIVTKKHNKRWVFRYTSPITKRVTETSIGNAQSWTYRQARGEAWKLRALIDKGQDPVEVKRQQKASGTTFEQISDEWIKINHNAWSAGQLRNVTLRLKKHGQFLASRPIAHIDPDTIARAIRPLWNKSPQQAVKTLAMWARIFAYAKFKKIFTGDNPAVWEGNMENLFHKVPKSNGHYAHLPYEQVPEVLKRLRLRQGGRGTAACALEFCILTATRSGETFGMTWDEINWDDRVWTIPAHRMKTRMEHRVPLSDRAMELLARQKEYRRNSSYVFTGYNNSQMDEKSMRVILHNMGVKVTVHGFRSSFKSWATEKTDFAWEVIELCLAHKVGSAVAQAYLRRDALNKRRVVMNQWASYCNGSSQ
jgi:integrase